MAQADVEVRHVVDILRGDDSALAVSPQSTWLRFTGGSCDPIYWVSALADEVGRSAVVTHQLEGESENIKVLE